MAQKRIPAQLPEWFDQNDPGHMRAAQKVVTDKLGDGWDLRAVDVGAGFVLAERHRGVSEVVSRDKNSVRVVVAPGTSPSDGQKFEVAVDSLNANYSFKYLGKDKGVSVVTFIDMRELMWHSTVISAAEREAAAAREAAARQAAAQQAATPAPAPAQRNLRPISMASPRYPPDALRAGTSGEVLVEFTVGTDGSVTDARVLRANPARTFDREALNAVRRWRFEPVDAPVTTRRTVAFNPGGG